ncbi:hypothetical protein DFJ67_3541 [Asanoa ferruginea]|uniref:Enoyl reductase (ER) domain-containing protein n=1 Tax=Asanoa ferruginea TaxID=53367 RepID=A0A3D9ZJZ6_9ACTN|nr:NADP-dependent oxidoreductase [Asanoa ferruginea]REF97537.1 hypothetical protein DFJ67_3541 [Asanoa ferruginea]GIF48638.1 NADP-dependent oxidoreductase [Asanoa ferruginea]
MNTEIRLARHLSGELTTEHFDVVENQEMPDGEVLVKIDYVGLAVAYLEMMRADSRLPIPPWQPGQRVGLAGVGTVVRSDSPALKTGDLVMTMAGWSEYAAGPAAAFPRLDRELSPVHHLGQGTTAYYGMVDIAEVGPGDVVFVSGAAGGVGSLAGQIARCKNAATVIGSAGSPAKVDYLVRELGFDAAFDYHDGPPADRLRALAPDGITVFFDNVGGEQFDAAVANARPGARFALCGSLATQIGGQPEPDLTAATAKGIAVRPFATHHTPDQIAAWQTHFAKWHAEGRFTFPHTIVDGGLKAVPAALVDLLAGAYRGNVAVRL